MILFVKFLFAHLMGDFILQPNSWVKNKEEKKLAAWQLYMHSLIHGVLVLLIVWDWYFWSWALLIAGMHFLIDAIKIIFQNKKTKRVFFFIDQILHIISLLLIWMLYQSIGWQFSFLWNAKTIAFLTAIFLLTLPTSVSIKIFISKWTPQTQDNDTESLQSAGKYIGIFERLFVLAFIITNHWEAIGFLLAAKSVFRFGDLKEAKDRKLTEYILIGTLLSFGIAVLTGLIYMHATK
jgi:hypothetical protein